MTTIFKLYNKNSPEKSKTKSKRNITEEKDKTLELLSILSPEIKLVSFLSLNMDHIALLKYMNDIDINTLNKPIIVDKDFTIKKEMIIYYVFLLAIINENPVIRDFIFNILKGLGNEINSKEFEEYVKSVNKLIQYKDHSMITGGSNIKKMLYELGLIGAFLYIAFYDYFIITSGVWSKFYDAAAGIVQIGSQIQDGCKDNDYTPSKSVEFMAKYGFGYYGIGKSDVVFKIDSVIQCLVTPTALSNNLQNIYKKENSEQMLMELLNGLSNNHPDIFSTKDNKKIKEFSGNMSKELVLRKPEFQDLGLVIKTPETNTIDVTHTLAQLQNLSEMQKDDFKKYIVTRMKPPTQPIIETADENSAKSYLSSVTTFVGDLYDVVKEFGIVEMTSASSLSSQNAILYSIQDSIRNTMRNIKKMQVELEIAIEDKIINASRLVSEISQLPSTLVSLFYLNATALFIICYFTNKMKKMMKNEAIKNETLRIENEELMLEDASTYSLKKSPKSISKSKKNRFIKNGGKKKNSTRRKKSSK